MRGFEHFSPTSLAEAVELLRQFNGRAAIIAGGTDLMLKLKAGTLRPQAVINIKRLSELQSIAFDPQAGLRLGATVTLRALTRSPIVRDHYPALASAAGLMASEQIRSLATIGGNLCNASPAADLAPPLIVLGAEVRLLSQEGERRVALEDFFVAPGASVLRPGELLMEIHIPQPRGEAVYLKLTPRAFMDIAVVGVAVRLEQQDGLCRDTAIALGAVAPTPLRARQAQAVLRDRPFSPELIEQAAQIAAAECSPIDDVRGSAWYRRQMVEAMVRRALMRLVADQ